MLKHPPNVIWLARRPLRFWIERAHTHTHTCSSRWSLSIYSEKQSFERAKHYIYVLFQTLHHCCSSCTTILIWWRRWWWPAQGPSPIVLPDINGVIGSRLIAISATSSERAGGRKWSRKWRRCRGRVARRGRDGQTSSMRVYRLRCNTLCFF